MIVKCGYRLDRQYAILFAPERWSKWQLNGLRTDITPYFEWNKTAYPSTYWKVWRRDSGLKHAQRRENAVMFERHEDWDDVRGDDVYTTDSIALNALADAVGRHNLFQPFWRNEEGNQRYERKYRALHNPNRADSPMEVYFARLYPIVADYLSLTVESDKAETAPDEVLLRDTANVIFEALVQQREALFA